MIIDFQVNKNNCWIWLKAKNPAGYGHLSIDGKFIDAHRWSYAAHYGEIPKGLVIRHLCGNTSCINPEHLKLGTIMDNNHDTMKMGRMKVPVQKLSWRDVQTIRQSHKHIKDLANEFDVGRDTIWRVKTGRTWKATL